METNAVERDVMEYDVAIVGGGPAGLSCAIRLKQLKPETNICVLEKASAVGAQRALRGCLEPGPLDALLPEWRRESPPAICVAAEARRIPLSDADREHSAAHPVSPAQQRQLHHLVGTAHALVGTKGRRVGSGRVPRIRGRGTAIRRGRIGHGRTARRHGHRERRLPGPNFAPGLEIRARTTVIAEGARGSIAKQLIRRFGLDARSCPQTLRTGPERAVATSARPGRAGTHSTSLGWPARYPHLWRQLHLSPRQ